MDYKYKGTTVNERLYLSGLSDKFDKAVKDKNIDEVVSILNTVEITAESLINSILEQKGLSKKKKG